MSLCFNFHDKNLMRVKNAFFNGKNSPDMVCHNSETSPIIKYAYSDHASAMRIFLYLQFSMRFFFKQKTAYEISACLVGSEMCIRDSCCNFHDKNLMRAKNAFFNGKNSLNMVSYSFETSPIIKYASRAQRHINLEIPVLLSLIHI